MRQANLIMMSAAMLLAACGGTKDAGKTDQVLIEKSDIKIEGKRTIPFLRFLPPALFFRAGCVSPLALFFPT